MTKREKPYLTVILAYWLPQAVFDAVDAYLNDRAKIVEPETPFLARHGMVIERGLVTTVKTPFYAMQCLVLQDVEKIVADVLANTKQND